MKLDPVLAEIRAYREAYSERFGGDISAMMADLREREAASGRKLVNRAVKSLPAEAPPPASMVELRKVKETVMQIPVAIEPTGMGGFRAQSVQPFTAVGVGNTREEALSKVRDELNKQLEQGTEIAMVEVGTKTTNPWLARAGWLKDDPLFEEWRAEVEAYRRQCDKEAGVEYDEQP